LTHGAKVNFSGKLFRAAQYGIHPETGEIDYEQVQRLAEEHRPKMIVAGFSAYSRVIDWARFETIARGVGAYFVVDMAHVAALGRANITVNKNAVPNGPRPPMVASGLRIGTPASTTRGFQVREVEQVADFIAEVLDAEAAPAAIERVRPKVLELCGRFPVYG